MNDICSRFELSRPRYLADDHWAPITTEAERLWRSLEADDGSQAIGDIKCLVESIARIVLDIDGTPAAPNIGFETLVQSAHKLLSRQPGRELANESPFGQVATHACKIARTLANIRNDFGGGHGRARTPALRDEMVALALDGGLLWSRWALRRVGYFSEGRPEPLIADLVTHNSIFHSGDLQRRLIAANLPALEPRHQRTIGVAVGQRVMQGTFVVRWDGLEPCLASDDLNTWPRDYRVGLVHGLWFDPNERLTLTSQSLKWALQVLDPVPDGGADLADWVDRITSARPAGGLSDDWSEAIQAEQLVRNLIAVRPPADQQALTELADNINPLPGF